MKVNDETEPVPDSFSRMAFFCLSESSFCLLSDDATILGFNYKEPSTIIKETISDLSQPIISYIANVNSVYSIEVDESNNMLFAGCDNDNFGQVVQFDLATGQVIKNYCQIDTSCIMSNIRLGSLLIFGGYDSSHIIVIDPVNRKILSDRVSTAVSFIHSIAFCTIDASDPKVLLFVVGKLYNYSQGKTDIFDITALLKVRANLQKQVINNEN